MKSPVVKFSFPGYDDKKEIEGLKKNEEKTTCSLKGT